MKIRSSFFIISALLAAILVTSCQRPPKSHHNFTRPVSGLSKSLAEYRAQNISKVQYRLSFNIPDSVAQPVTGREYIHLSLDNDKAPLILDFKNAQKLLDSLKIDGHIARYTTTNGHILIPNEELHKGDLYLEFKFRSGNEALNRNPNYMYSLFVPDLAHTAFPCFDQPDIRAGFQLSLTLPDDWTAITNAPLLQKRVAGDHVYLQYGETPSLSTYQFAFAAGRYQTMTEKWNGRQFTMYYREKDTKLVDRNTRAIFDLVGHALHWLKNYTDIPFPYNKYDFLAVPSFQFGGMEHPGAVYFKASGLFLRPTATINDSLGRATLISHETSHMWFGDMVTMKWFNDVWTKEVFAQFMADKIVQQLYPKINFDQRFLLTHYPSAYAKDRSEGAEAIRQPLYNMLNASNMYIMAYDKAPIVMRQLEQIIGPEKFREGLREYLNTYRFSNATWGDLISILDKYTSRNLEKWNKVWVEDPGRPTIETNPEFNANGHLKDIIVTQSDPSGHNKIWPQKLNLLLDYHGKKKTIPFFFDKSKLVISSVNGDQKPDFILPNGKGIAYGYFKLDKMSRDYLLKHLPEIEDPTTRSIAWVTLWDNFLEGEVSASQMLNLEMKALPDETNELNIHLILGYLSQTYWQYMGPKQRANVAGKIENLLWDQMEKAHSVSIKSGYFSSFRSIVTSKAGLNKLYRIWNKKLKIDGLTFSQRDYTAMAAHLALNEYPGWEKILDAQQKRLIDPDRIDQFKFVRPALSDKQSVRDQFFNSLKKVSNRAHEPWVIQGLEYLNYPPRAKYSIRYILPGLKLLKEVQATGDIFFPGRWVQAVLSGHRSKEAAKIVRNFLKKRPDYPRFLKDKILQAADPIFRASSVVKE